MAEPTLDQLKNANSAAAIEMALARAAYKRAQKDLREATQHAIMAERLLHLEHDYGIRVEVNRG
jgi:hypothetical protein